MTDVTGVGLATAIVIGLVAITPAAGFVAPFGAIVLGGVLRRPIGEELLFPGLILDGLLKRYKAETAIVISAVLFGLIHLNPWQGVGAVFLGIALGWFRWKTGSVFLPIVGHFVNNAFAFGVMYLLDIEIRGFTTIGDAGKFQPVWFTLGGAAVAAVCFWGLVLHFRKREQAGAPAEAG